MGFYDFLLSYISFEHMAEDVNDLMQQRRKKNVLRNFEYHFWRFYKGDENFWSINLLIYFLDFLVSLKVNCRKGACQKSGNDKKWSSLQSVLRVAAPFEREKRPAVQFFNAKCVEAKVEVIILQSFMHVFHKNEIFTTIKTLLDGPHFQIY